MDNQELKLLACPTCGQTADPKCPQCKGHNIIGWLKGNVLYWPENITPLYLRRQRTNRIIEIIINVLLIIFGLLGVAALVWHILNSDFNDILSYRFWISHNVYLLIFYISLFTDCFLIFQFDKIKGRKEVVLQKEFKLSDQMPAQYGQPVPGSWEEIMKMSRKNKIDIRKAFDKEATNSVYEAYKLAFKYNSKQMEPVHLFVALVSSSPRISVVISRLGIDVKKMANNLSQVVSSLESADKDPIFSIKIQKTLLQAYYLAYNRKQKHVRVGELLLACLKESPQLQEVIFDLGVNQDQLTNVVEWLRFQDMLREYWQRYKKSASLRSKSGLDRAMTAVATKFLNAFSEDLTQAAKYGYLFPCVARDKEIEEVLRIIESQSGSVVLVGQPGVGKTAIIEGIAQRIITGDVPKILQEKRLVSLSLSRLVSGASASEAAERLMVLIDEAAKAGNVVFYISNIHELIGISSGGQQSMDLSDILGEAISSGRIIVLADTNDQNYSQYLERTSLGSILQKVKIEEIDINGAIQILEARSGAVENKNSVFFSYGALESAVVLSDRFMHDRFLPDKALDIMEQTALFVRQSKGTGKSVQAEDVANIVSNKTGIPLTQLTTSETEKLLNLEDEIHKRMVDQEEAVKAVATSLRRARAELRTGERPIVNLLFLGPTGVGKTELTKTIAQIYFGSEENMIRLDMSEYQAKDSINRLIGTPSGFEGAGPGQLTEAVRKNPFSIVLLDELEKAHPDILNIFLQVMDDGRLSDASGRTIDFTNTIVIATSNAGTKFVQEQIKAGTEIETIKRMLLEKELLEVFRPEFLNRFDNICLFKPLSFEDIVKIAGFMLKKVTKNLEKKGIHFEASKEAIEELAKAGFDPLYGARPMRRAIQDKVDNAIAEIMLKGQVGRRDKLILDVGGQIRVEKAKGF